MNKECIYGNGQVIIRDVKGNETISEDSDNLQDILE